jgi:sec-independent protein translocase protein TatB
MFDIGWSELVVIGVVALIVIGPKELPGVLRMAGQWITKIRRMASEFQGQFQEAMREAEMADLKKQVDDIADSTRDLTTHFDPIGSMQDAIGDPFEEKKPAGTPSATSPQGADTVAPAQIEPAAAMDPEPTSVAEVPHNEERPADATPQKAAAGGQPA